MCMKSILIFIALFFLFGLFNVLNACDEKKEIDTEKSIKENVLSNPDSIKQGEKIFNALCAYCHGGAGTGGRAKKLAGGNLKIDYIFKTITNGKKRGSLNMPPWKKLPEEKRWKLVSYVYSLQKDNL